MLIAMSSIYKTQAQSSDSTFIVTDTSITTSQNMVITDRSGNATLFAGGENSDYAGRVGIGSDQPKDKLAVYDDDHATFSLFQCTNAAATGLIGLRMSLRASSTSTSPVVVFSTSAYTTSATPPPTLRGAGPIAVAPAPDIVSCDLPELEYIAKKISFKTVNPSSSPVAGTSGSHPECVGIARMTLLNSGHLGIGTEAPIEKLHLSGGNLRISSTSSTLFLGSTGTYSGRVGIGTATPTARLHISTPTLPSMTPSLAAIQVTTAGLGPTDNVFSVHPSGFTSIGAAVGPQTGVLNVNCWGPNTTALAVNLIQSDGTTIENFKVSNEGRIIASNLLLNTTGPSATAISIKQLLPDASIIENFLITNDGKVKARQLRIS